MGKVFVLGLDGMPPMLAFNKWEKHMPNLNKLIKNGCHGEMQTTIPPSTIVAWSAFCSGRDAGELDVYAYTHQTKKNSHKRKFSDSTCKKKPMIWDELTKQKKRSIVLNVPLTYPSSKLNGKMVTDFLTPEINDKCCYPSFFKKNLKKFYKGKDYMFDVGEFTEYKRLTEEILMKKTFEMTEMHFKLLFDLIEKEKWDFFITEIIGTDRLLHLFWHYIDVKHLLYKKNKRKEKELINFFKYVDNQIGKIRKSLPEDAYFIVASDHGMDRMDGKINVNDWLIKEGYLALTEEFNEKIKKEGPQKIKLHGIDWSKTKAYCIGSYQGRLHINLKRRDKNGIIAKKDFNNIRNEIANKMRKIKGVNGRKLKNYFFKPEKIYKNGFGWRSPDMIVYFDNLIYGTNDEVGHNSLYVKEKTLVGKTYAGHSPKGIFAIEGKGIKKKNLKNLNILDMAPTIYNLLEAKAPKNLQGKKLNLFK